jgi:hypothetical protein
LQQLRLVYFDPDVAAATASAWGKLPQLCELSCQNFGYSATEQEWAAIIAGLTAATSLTKLDVCVGVKRVSYDAAEQLSAASTAAGEMPGVSLDTYASIARLTRLKHLDLDCSSLQAKDAGASTMDPPALVLGGVAAFTALTGLTYLSLSHGGACVSNAAAVALAFHLTQLRELRFWQCRLGGMSCLEGIAQLPYLRVLHLGVCPGLTQQRLMLLTGLRCLQELSFHVNEEVTDAVVGAFQKALSAASGQGWQLHRSSGSHSTGYWASHQVLTADVMGD